MTDSAAAQEVRAEYGDDANNFYAADTFNEMDPGTNDPAYLRNASSAVYNAGPLGPSKCTSLWGRSMCSSPCFWPVHGFLGATGCT